MEVTKFIWDEKYSVGLSSLDKQHKRFFEIGNNLIDLAEKPEPTHNELLSMIKELEDYAFYHLKTEEELFEKFQYPESQTHIEAHEQYRDKVKHYLAIVSAESPSSDLRKLAEEIASYSIYWLTNHILIMDKEYTAFFLEHGVK